MMDCSKCGRKDTKYCCIGCKISICNICSVACSENTHGYSEKDFLVGKCSACHTKSNPHHRQSFLLDFLTKKSQKTPTSTPLNKEGKPSLKKVKNTGPQPSTSQTSRNLNLTTANRWKTTSLAKHLANEWLLIDSDSSGFVTSLRCSVCNTYADKVKGMKNFSSVWAYAGSTNLRLSNAEDHARGEPHKRAMDILLKEGKGQSVSERAVSLSATNESGQQLITNSIAQMKVSELITLRRKFEVAYFIAKEQLPLAKYPRLLKLEEKHGVEIGNTYLSDMSCNTFLSFIAEVLVKQISETLSRANFFSVLSDGSEDVTVIEKEAIFVQHLDKSPPGQDTVKVVTTFLGLSDLKYSTAAGIVSSIKNSFGNIGISEETFKTKLVGFGADGATVNRGHKDGVIGLLQNEIPWTVFVWCVAHRLELSLKDALKETCFDDVDDVVLRLYYLYENSPKKLRQLRELHLIYAQTFEFEEGGVRPKRASGKLNSNKLQY